MTKYKVLAIFLLAFFATRASWGQAFPIPDSAAAQLTALSGADRAVYLKDLGNDAYRKKAFPLATYYWEAGYRWADSLGLPSLAGQCLNNLGGVAYREQEYLEYMNYARQAVGVYARFGLDSLRGGAEYNVALAFKKIQLLDSALKHLSIALDIFQSTQDSVSYYKTLTVAGNLNRQLYRFDDAEDYLKRVVLFHEGRKDRGEEAKALNNLANVYFFSGQIQKSYPLYYQSLSLRATNQAAHINYYNLGRAYAAQFRHDSALYYHEKALALRTKPLDQAYSWRAMGTIHFNDGRLPRARDAYRRALNLLEADAPFELFMEIYEGLKNVELRFRNYQQAQVWQDSTVRYENRLADEKRTSTTQYYAEVLNNTELKNAREVDQLKLEAQGVRLQRNRLLITIIAVVALLAGVAFFFAYRSYRWEQQSKKRISTVLRELHHRLKNHLQSVTGVIQVHLQTISEPSTRSVLQTTHDQIAAINMVHKNLYQGSEDQLADVDLQAYLEMLVGNILLLSQLSDEDTELSVGPVALDVSQAVPLGLIINEVVTNATKYGRTLDTGRLSLRVLLSRSGNTLHLHISDRGPGCRPQDRKQGSVGYSLIEKMARQLRATYTVSEAPGLTFELQMKINA